MLLFHQYAQFAACCARGRAPSGIELGNAFLNTAMAAAGGHAPGLAEPCQPGQGHSLESPPPSPAAPENPKAAATTVRLGSDFIRSHGYPSPSPIRLAALSQRVGGSE